jgi:hypothetical protein
MSGSPKFGKKPPLCWLTIHFGICLKEDDGNTALLKKWIGHDTRPRYTVTDTYLLSSL